MARTNVVVRKPTAGINTTQVFPLGATAFPGIGALARLASSRRIPVAASATMQAGALNVSSAGAGQTVLGISGDMFTINGVETFLLGCSYFQALHWHTSDINSLDARGFNWIRIFLENDPGLAALQPNGTFSGASTIQALCDYCDARGIIVEVVIFDWEWGAEADPPQYLTAIDNVTAALANKTNIFYDVLNEHNLMGASPGFPGHSTLATWISRVRAGDPGAIVKTSTARGHVGGIGDGNTQILTADVDSDLALGVDLMSPHFDRGLGWDTATFARVTNLKNHLVSVGQNKPVILSEEQRRGTGAGAGPIPQSEFETACLGAFNAGAAGWLFHNDDCFILSDGSMFSKFDSVDLATVNNLNNVINTAPPATDVTTFTLTSSAAGTQVLPFTLGHAFKQGDVPSGQFIVADIPNFQGEVRNRWPDGSVKYAVLSGRTTLISGNAATVTVRKQATNPGGTNIQLATLQLLNPSVSMALSGFGTVTLSSLLASPVRSFLGPQMSEFHFRSAVGSDAHLAVWMFIRLYGDNSIEIETCVENGYMKVAGPVDKSYTATLTINGTVRYSGTLTHWPRTRWMTINWYNGTSGLTDFLRVLPSHNTAYLRSTKQVPNYTTQGAPTTTYLNNVTQTIQPLVASSELMNGGANMNGPGVQDFIGLLPRWAASYFVSGDTRAYKAIVAQTYSSNAWPVCYRDESTQRPLAITTRPNLDAAGWNLDSVVIGQGSNARGYIAGTQSHHPEMGYSGYLVTGRWTHLETCAFWAARSHLEQNPVYRGVSQTGTPPFNGGNATTVFSEDRARAWHMRTVACTASIYPDASFGLPAADNLVRSDWITGLGNSFIFWAANDTLNPLGYFHITYTANGDYAEYSGTIGPPPNFGRPTFMGYFGAQCLGFTWDLELHTGAARTAHTAYRDHLYKLPVGMLGDSTGWCFRAGPQYSAALGTVTGTPGNMTITWDSTWAQAYARSDVTGPDDLVPTSSKPCTLGGSIQTGHFEAQETWSYGGNLHPAIAYAVEHGAPGASAAYARFQGASNYPAFAANWPAGTQFGIIPRSDPGGGGGFPSWYPSAAGQIVQLPGSTTIGSAVRANGGDAYNAAGSSIGGTDPDDIVETWGSAALITISGQKYLVAMGGGHGDSSYNGSVKYGPLNGAGSNTPLWTAHKAPSPTSAIRPNPGPTFPTNLDGLRVSNHEYGNIVGVGATVYAMCGGGAWPADQFSEAFALTATTQTQLATNPGSSANAPQTGGACAHYNGKIYWLGGNSDFTPLRIYDIATNTWSASGAADIFRQNYQCSAVDTTRGAMLNCNGSNGIYWNLNTLVRSTGKAAPPSFSYALLYDPARDAFVSFVSGSTQVLECSASSLASGGTPAWTTRTFSGTTPQAAPGQGMFGRWQYVSELNGYICAPNLESPTYFYRST